MDGGVITPSKLAFVSRRGIHFFLEEGVISKISITLISL